MFVSFVYVFIYTYMHIFTHINICAIHMYIRMDQNIFVYSRRSTTNKVHMHTYIHIHI